MKLGYLYDRSSNRLTRTDTRPGASWADRDFRYEYDGLDRLVQADRGAEGGSWSSAVGGQQWALDMLGNWDFIWNDTNGDGNYTSSSPDEEQERTHNFANEIEDITTLPFAYDAAGNMTEQGQPAAATKYYTHDAWNRLTEVKIDAAVLGQYEYNALHWRGVKRARSPGAGSLDEMRLMYYSANWQLLEERIDRSWTSGFTEDERAQTFWGKRYIDDAVGRRRDRDANGTWDNNFFYVTDAQFSTVAMVSASNARIVERITYDVYGKARHHFGGDVTGDGAATAAGDDAALVTTIGLRSNSIGQANYKAEQDLNRDGQITSADRTTLSALTGGADQAALASGMVSFTTTGSGGTTVHGPDNPIAWDGYVFNPETGQYIVRFRWYDPVLGRWLEQDIIVYFDCMSLYNYTGSRPTILVDPYGLAWGVPEWLKKCGAGVGLLLTAGYLIYENVTVREINEYNDTYEAQNLSTYDRELLTNLVALVSACELPDYAAALESAIGSDSLLGPLNNLWYQPPSGQVLLEFQVVSDPTIRKCRVVQRPLLFIAGKIPSGLEAKFECSGFFKRRIYLGEHLLIDAAIEEREIPDEFGKRMKLLSTLMHEVFHSRHVYRGSECRAYTYEVEVLNSMLDAMRSNTTCTRCRFALSESELQKVIEALESVVEEAKELQEEYCGTQP